MIPVYVNNRDRLGTTRALVEYLLSVDGVAPVVVDNASTYPPLLEWYAKAPCQVILTGKNGGTLAVYGALHPPEEHRRRFGTDLLMLTDSDLDLSRVPKDFPAVLEEGLRRYPGVAKAGLGLAIDDIPDSSPWKQKVLDWESKFWQNRLDDLFFSAPVDTTFCMTRVWQPFSYSAVRADLPYVARHVPWYKGPDELDEDERYYLEHARPQGTMWTAQAVAAMPQPE